MAQYNPLTAAAISPDLLARQLKLQRQAQNGQQMMQSSEMPQGSVVSGHYVAPSFTQYLAQGLRGYLGRREMDDALKGTTDLAQEKREGLANAFGFGPPSPQALADGLAPGKTAEAYPVGQSGVPQQAPGSQQTIPSLPGRSARESLMIAELVGMPKYMELLATQGAPTSEQRNLSFLPQEQRDQLIAAPFMNEAGKDGVQMSMGPDGRMRAVPVQGYAETRASIAGAEAGATTAAQEAARYPYDVGRLDEQARRDPMQVVNPATGDTEYRTRADVAQGGATAAVNPVRQRAAEVVNDDWLKNSYRPVLDKGSLARDSIASITAMRSIPIDTGFGTEAKAAAASFLASMGVKDAEKYAANAEVFRNFTLQRVNEELRLNAGVQTEGDAQRAERTTARLGNTPQANKFILDYAQAVAELNAKKAAFYERALPLAQKEGDLAKVDRMWRKVSTSIWDSPMLAPWKEAQ